MRHCANTECPHVLKHGVPAEYVDSVVECPDCGLSLQLGAGPNFSVGRPAPRRPFLPTRLAYGLRFAGIVCLGWLISFLFPALILVLALPAAPVEFLSRPYTLVTYWLLNPGIDELGVSLLGILIYSSVLQPRTSFATLAHLAAVAIAVAGILHVSLPTSGLLGGAMPVVAGFAGAVLRIWMVERSSFLWWEHVVAAYAAFGTSIALLAALSDVSNLLTVGTALSGFVYFSLRRAGAPAAA